LSKSERATDGPEQAFPSEQDLIEQVRQAWADVLDVGDAAAVPLDANFLEVGGSSLLLILLWEQLHGMTGRDVKVSDLFEHSTVRAQSRLLGGEDDHRVPNGVGTRDRRQLFGRARREHLFDRPGGHAANDGLISKQSGEIGR
jgi:aryl carrier-like protein